MSFLSHYIKRSRFLLPLLVAIGMIAYFIVLIFALEYLAPLIPGLIALPASSIFRYFLMPVIFAFPWILFVVIFRERTINASEIRALVEPARNKGIKLIDSPVSGGKSGADEGTLTLMAAAEKAVLEEYRPVLEAISKAVFHVGETISQGQVVKAALQALIGSTFTAIFESLVLGTKAGADPETFFVFNQDNIHFLEFARYSGNTNSQQAFIRFQGFFGAGINSDNPLYICSGCHPVAPQTELLLFIDRDKVGA